MFRQFAEDNGLSFSPGVSSGVFILSSYETSHVNTEVGKVFSSGSVVHFLSLMLEKNGAYSYTRLLDGSDTSRLKVINAFDALLVEMERGVV